MGKDLKYEVIPRGANIAYITPGKWTFIQRKKEYGGGWWFGRVYDDYFLLEFERPTSLVDGIAYINAYGKLDGMPDWEEEFSLEG
ncbi:lF-82 [Enterobacter hormaechei]|uniref:lF-82 n=1 Tax=Enterobacter hormaechei TaxID=158836 RepID=UPI00115E32AE|nr:lF-82 [Enterobacter hormaechei]